MDDTSTGKDDFPEEHSKEPQDIEDIPTDTEDIPTDTDDAETDTEGDLKIDTEPTQAAADDNTETYDTVNLSEEVDLHKDTENQPQVPADTASSACAINSVIDQQAEQRETVKNEIEELQDACAPVTDTSISIPASEPECSKHEPQDIDDSGPPQPETDSEQTVSKQHEQARVLRQRKAPEQHTPPAAKKRRINQKQAEAVTTPIGSVKPASKKSTPDSEGSSVEKRKLIPRRPGITWNVGCKLEAMDFLKNWYPAKIVEIDETEAEVLIHFDGWSSRFDEWVEMKSDRLRALTNTTQAAAVIFIAKPPPTHQVSELDLAVGTVVLAKWTKVTSKSAVKYPAIIKSLPTKTGVKIQFYDGVELETDLSCVQNLHPELQKEALHIWDIMKEINEGTAPTPPPDKKVSRRESMEARRAQQDKMDAAEVLLTKLVEKSQMSKYNKAETLPETPTPSDPVTEPSQQTPAKKTASKTTATLETPSSPPLAPQTDNIKKETPAPKLSHSQKKGSQSTKKESVPPSKEVQKKRDSQATKPEAKQAKKDHQTTHKKSSAKKSADDDKTEPKADKRRSSLPSVSPGKSANITKKRSSEQTTNKKSNRRAKDESEGKPKTKSPEKLSTKTKSKSGGRLIVAGFSMKKRAEKHNITKSDIEKKETIPSTDNTGTKAKATSSTENSAKKENGGDTLEPAQPSGVESTEENITADQTSLPSSELVERTESPPVRSNDVEEKRAVLDTTAILTSIARVNLGKKEGIVTDVVAKNRSKSTDAAQVPVRPKPRAAKSHSSDRRASVQESSTKPKAAVGYTMVLEPVDAVPAKAFVVEEKHNQHECPHCNKGFRKESLLQSHIRHYHNPGSHNAPPAKRRRKTLSLCSTDSERTPQSTAPPTPLASPTPPKEMVTPTVSRRVAIKSASKVTEVASVSPTPTTVLSASAPADITPTVVEGDYEADTDEEEGGDGGSYQTEVVNCSCGFNEEDGLMIQCEFCCCWQHAECCKYTDGELPDRYICFICLNTPGARESCRYLYNQDWLRKGSLPKLEFLSSMSSDSSKKESIIRDSHKEMLKLQHKLSSLSSMKRLLDSAEKGDIYELALWSPEDSGTEQTDSDNNNLTDNERLRLHIKNEQDNMQNDLDDIEAKISALENEAGLSSVRPGEDLVSTSKTLVSLISDLNKVAKLTGLLGDEGDSSTNPSDLTSQSLTVSAAE